MHWPAGVPRRLRFDEFELDARSRELSKAGVRVRVADQAIEVLLALLEQPGELVTREQLRERLWRADTFVDFEHGLNTSVRRLRQALGDSAATPRFVETLPRRGYRFIGDVAPVPPDTGVPAGASPRTDEPTAPHPGAATGVTGEQAPAPPTSDATLPAGTRLSRASVVVAVAIVVVVVLAASRLRPRAIPTDEGEPVLTRLTFAGGLQAGPSLSPDGTMVAYGADTAGNFDVWMQPVEGGRAVQLTTDPAHDWQPDWSPDGTSIVFRSERGGGGIYVVPARGGHEQRILPFGYSPRWSPDGSRVAVADASGQGHPLFLSVVPRTGGPAVRLADRLLTPRERQSAFGWSPHHDEMLVLGGESPDPFWLLTIRLEDGAVRRWQVAAAVQRTFSEHRLSVERLQGVAWDAARDVIYFVGQSHGLMNVWSVQVDSGRHEVVGGPHRMTTNQDATTTVSLSRDGRRLAFDAAVRTSRIVSFELGSDGPACTGVGEPLTPDTVHAHSPDLSPDSTQVAFLRERLGTPARSELVVLDRETGTERVLAVGDKERGELRGPPLRWSPDGTRLAYRYVLPDSRVPDGERRAFGSFQQVRLFDLRSDQEYEITSPAQINDVPFGWSRNGDEIISTGRRYRADRAVAAFLPVTAAPHAEGQARVFTTAPDAGTDLWQASVSPDGRWLLFQATDGDRRRARLVVAPVEGDGAWRDLTDGSAWDDKPRWSHDGSLVYFVTTRGGLPNVWAVAFDQETGVARGEPRRVTNFTGPGEQILHHVGLMELAIREGRLMVPVVHPRGGIWMLENLTR